MRSNEKNEVNAVGVCFGVHLHFEPFATHPFLSNVGYLDMKCKRTQ